MKTSTSNIRTNGTADASVATHAARRGTLVLRQSVRWLSFWTAIILPLLYLPVLYVGAGSQTGPLFLGLLGLQLVALLVGHGYNRSEN